MRVLFSYLSSAVTAFGVAKKACEITREISETKNLAAASGGVKEKGNSNTKKTQTKRNEN